MVVKVTTAQLHELMNEIYVPMTSAYYTGAWVEKFTQGNVVLSVKKGKHWKLLKGKMMCQGYSSSRLSSGHVILQFKPNNVAKATTLFG